MNVDNHILWNQQIHLRAAEPEDLDVIYQWENDSQLWNVSNTLTPLSRFTLKLYLERAGEDIYQTKQLRLMIIKNNNNRVLGAIDLFDYEPLHQRIGIGIYIDKIHQNQTFGAQSIELIKQYVFQHLQLHQLYCNINTNNEISVKLFQKQGFVIAGTKKDWIKTLHGFEDEYLLQCINHKTLNQNK